MHWLASLVQGTIRLIISVIVFNPNLGPLRYITGTIFFYCLFAVFLVYIFAPIRGWAGSIWLGPQIHYASERWLGTAIYEKDGHFIGTFDPNMDSKRDLNTSGKPIVFDELNYVANPDHTSIPVHTVPDHFWKCLTYHEDRHLGGLFNPFGIDIIGVLKIPYTTAIRSYKAKKLAFGVGGSTLPMQLVRVYHSAPQNARMVERTCLLLGTDKRRQYGAVETMVRQSPLACSQNRRPGPARHRDHLAHHLWQTRERAHSG
jgi:membrane peptidoglycan carboxypeptidase